MCKFNLADAIATSLEPLSGWPQPKAAPAPAADWHVPATAPPPAGHQQLTAAAHAEDAGIPDDLQDLFLDSPCSVTSLPDENANSILEDLLSGSVRENLEPFGDLSPVSDSSSDCGEFQLPAGPLSPQQQQQRQQQHQHQLHSPAYGIQLSGAGPHQMSPESWGSQLSPAASGSSGGEEAWPPVHRRRPPRPRPYDKPSGKVSGAAHRQPLTDEERRQKKKEQNKNAATRYRQKKKEQQETVSWDEQFLESRNKQLRTRVGGLTKELLYLRQLMREVLQRRRGDA